MIPEVNPYNNYRGDGVATLFDYDFFIQNGSQLIVEHIDENDVVTRLEENIDYEIVVIEEEFAGYIKFPIEDSKFGILQENETLSLQLTLPFEQISEYGQSSLLDLNSIEFSLDYLTRLCQILKRQMERSIKVSEGSEATPEELLETINNNAIVSTNAAAIASKKADEAMESANVAINASEEIDIKINGFNESYENIKEEIIEEGEKQLQNVQSTGFYMRDDKLYFINSKGEEEEFKSGGSGFNLGDMIITDHILEGEAAIGKALQGTYVYKNAVAGERLGYPDFYNIYLQRKNESTPTEVTLGESTLTMYVNSNGHQFYNIADKSIVDTFYEVYGIADFYGIDEENERIFLPRNKWFAIKGSVDSVPVYGNGMTLGLTYGNNKNAGLVTWTNSAYKSANVFYDAYGTNVGVDATANITEGAKTLGVTTDPTKSGIIADTRNVVQPNENRYLYYCVGNTEVTQAITNVTEVTTSENDTIPLFTGMYFDFKPNNVSWLKAGEQQNSSGIYTSCYEGLVNAVNGTNPQNLKVINQADMVSGVVYDEYWILDQDNLTFRTPLTISLKAYNSLASVAGNGKALGLSDGTNNVGLCGTSTSTNSSLLGSSAGAYNSDIGSTGQSTTNTSGKVLGVTTDPTKSGIEAHLVENTTAQLYFKVANAVQNLELLDAGEVMEGLATKLDRGNKAEIISWGMPDYNAGVSITLPYTATKDGVVWLSVQKTTAGGTGSGTYYINDAHIYTFSWYSGHGRGTTIVPISKGDVLTVVNENITNAQSFFPLKGAN